MVPPGLGLVVEDKPSSSDLSTFYVHMYIVYFRGGARGCFCPPLGSVCPP